MIDDEDSDSNDWDRFDLEISTIFRDALRSNTDCRQLLRERADSAPDTYCKGLALSILGSECVRQRDFKGAEEAFLECLALDPTSSVSGMALARFYAFDLKDLERALETAQWVADGNFRRDGLIRFVHADRIRIAIAAQRPDVAEDSLKRMISQDPRTEEIRLEKDFLPKLGPLGVSPELIQQYEALSLRPEEEDKVVW